MTNSNATLEFKFLHRIKLIFNMLQHCAKFPINKSTVAAFIRKKLKRVYQNSFYTCLSSGVNGA